MFVSTHKIYNQ